MNAGPKQVPLLGRCTVCDGPCSLRAHRSICPTCRQVARAFRYSLHQLLRLPKLRELLLDQVERLSPAEAEEVGGFLVEAFGPSLHP